MCRVAAKRSRAASRARRSAGAAGPSAASSSFTRTVNSPLLNPAPLLRELLEGGGQAAGVVAAGGGGGGHLGGDHPRPQGGEGLQLPGGGGRVPGPLAEHGRHPQAGAVVEDGGQVALGREAAGP